MTVFIDDFKRIMTTAPSVGNKKRSDDSCSPNYMTLENRCWVDQTQTKNQKRAKNERISVTARVTSAEISGLDVSPRLKKPCCIEGKPTVAELAGRAESNEPPVKR